MPTPKELRELYAMMLPLVKENCKSEIGLMPTVFALTSDRQLVITGLTFSNHREKRAMFATVDKQLAKIQSPGLMFVSEAWMAAIEAKTMDEVVARRKLMPDDLGDHPGRDEILMVSLITHGWSEFYRIKMKRDEKKLEFDEPVVSPHNDMEQFSFEYFQRWVS